MTQSIVIHGPQGCGKSVNAQRLRRKFGLLVVIELDGHPEQRRYITPEGALVLTNDEARANSLGLRVMGFKEAMREAGFLRSPKG